MGERDIDNTTQEANDTIRNTHAQTVVRPGGLPCSGVRDLTLIHSQEPIVSISAQLSSTMSFGILK